MQISSPSFGRLVFSTWKTCSQKTGEDKSDTIRHSLTLESSMRHRSCIEAEGGSHAETCQVVLDEFLTFNPTTLTSSRCKLCQQFFLTSTCRKLSSPHAVSEKNPYNLLQIATKLQRPGLQTIKQKKQWAVWKKKNLQTVPKIFSHQKHGDESFFSMKKKNECFTVSFFHFFLSGRPASPWMPTSTGFVRPIRSPLMSTYSQLEKRWKQTNPGWRRNDIEYWLLQVRWSL